MDAARSGLGTTSTAPNAKARMAFALLACATELTTITRAGCDCMSFLRKVSPSIRGISMSSVTTSGASSTMRSRAS